MQVTEYVRIGIYSTILAHYMYVTYYYQLMRKHPKLTGEDFQVFRDFYHFYFTGWNFTAQVNFVIIALSEEVLDALNKFENVKNALKIIRNYFFSAIIFPCSLLVFLTFWCLYYTDRELVFPKVLDEVYPIWLNHTVHSCILTPLIVEICLTKKKYSVDFWKIFMILTAIIIGYEIILVVIYFSYGVWLYPVMLHLPYWYQKVALFLTMYSISIMLLIIGNYLIRLRVTAVKNVEIKED